ncbi:hypothetical protein [Actinomadura sediminis]|uniref:DUF4352 domain-containing protein n=1 Tax=Actinomadura sediminis TaxID=1038904 RepID=A0ABW3ERV5_9ACTN
MNDPHRPPEEPPQGRYGRRRRPPADEQQQPPPPPPFVPHEPPPPQPPWQGAGGPQGTYPPPATPRYPGPGTPQNQPTGRHEQSPGHDQSPGHQPPTGGYRQPQGWQQQPTGGYRQPPGWQQHGGGYGQPAGGEPRGRHARPAQPQQTGPYAPVRPPGDHPQQPWFQPPPPPGGPPPPGHPFAQPPPGGRPDGRDDEPDGASPRARRTRLGPRTRRVVEACALAVLLPGLLGLYWVDETGRAESLEPPVKVSSVARGEIGELAGARWTVYKRESAPLPGSSARDAVQLQVVLAVKAQDAESVKTIGGYGMEYRFTDARGREWTANASKPVEVTPGQAFPLTVRGTVPRAGAESLALVVRPPETERRGGDPLPSLRFEP